jgi:nucleobase:cation symporter-1, NCS1 family
VKASLAGGVLEEVRLSAALAEVGREDVRARTLSSWDQAALWASLGVGLVALAPGALMVPAGSIGPAIATAAAGAVAGATMIALAARAGARDRRLLTAAIEQEIGPTQANTVGGLLVLRHVVFAALLLSLMASAASYLVGPLVAGGDRLLWVVLFASLGLLLALTGPHLVVPWLVKRLAAPLALVIMGVIAISSYLELGVPELMRREPIGGWPTPLQGVDLVALGALAWLPLAADFSRFSARGASSALPAFAAYAPATLLVAVIGILYVPLVHAGESWELLTAVPVVLVAMLMLLAIEVDGVAVLLYATGSVGHDRGQNRKVVTIAGALAAGVLAIAITPADLGPAAMVLGLLFLPPVLLWALVPDQGRRLSEAGRKRVWIVAWAAGFIAGLWSAATYGLLWGEADLLGPFLALFPDQPPTFGVLLPAVLVTYVACWLAKTVVSRERAR